MLDPEKCCMTRFPAPVLAEKAKPIETIDDSIRRLAARMIDLMVEYKGVGLAGPQAGVDLRIFVASPDGTRENAKVYINPEIEPSGPLESVEEGCLSLPGLYAKIRRSSQCTVTATDLDGNRFTESAEGLLARAYQHEFDHLEGKLIKDRFTRIQQIASRRFLRELKEEYGEPSS